MSNHTSPLLSLDHVSRHAVFHHFLSDDSKQDSATSAEHSKHIIELLKNRTVLFSDMSIILENTDSYAEQY